MKLDYIAVVVLDIVAVNEKEPGNKNSSQQEEEEVGLGHTRVLPR